MPRCVCDTPKTLFNICVEYAAVNIDEILKYEEIELTVHCNRIKFHGLPTSLHQLVLNKFLEIGMIHDGNYRKLLNHRTRNLVLGSERCDISNPVEFLEYIRDNCNFIVKLNLTPLLSSESWKRIDRMQRRALLCETLSSMVQLEWIDFSNNDDFDDKCLEVIGSNCRQLKYLNLDNCFSVTEKGLDEIASNCKQLSQLYLRDASYAFVPEWVSSFVLLCPELEVLDYQYSGKSVMDAIESIILLERMDTVGPDHNHDSNSSNSSESRSFKIKDLSMDCAQYPLKQHKFWLIGKYCPYLASLTLLHPHYLESGAFNGILHLPLHSIMVDVPNSSEEPISRDVLLLLRSVGTTLNTLKLSNQSDIDLRAISRACPSLTELNMTLCDTAEAGDISLPNYPVSASSVALFKSMEQLTLSETVIWDNSFTALLISPNLESH